MDDLDEDFVSINDVLFDAYHWAVSPKVIELMRQLFLKQMSVQDLPTPT